MGQQLQLEERQRVEPLVDEEQHQQAGAAAKQHRDQRRIEPVQARALGQAQHQHHQCRQPQGQAHAVELGKALQAHRVLRQAPADHHHAGHAERHDLPERELPTGVLDPHPPGHTA
ncbi:hypothetical protein G6F63_014839 [Rhizopus arrhizus]|nr:hypothetical protein G6F63_014839 [Rhizopus arrhizus]